MTELELKEYIEATPADVYMVTLQKDDEQTTLALDFKISHNGMILVYIISDINRDPMGTEEDLIKYVKTVYAEERFEEKLESERKYIFDGYFYEIGSELYLSLEAEEIVTIEPISLQEFIAKVAKEWVMEE